MKKFMMIIMAVALMALPAMAQQQEWKSTSTLQSASGSYTAPITEVGATNVPSEATTTTESYSPAKAPGPRKGFIDPNNPGNQSNEYPVGDAVLPLMVCAAVFCGVIALRRKRSALKG